MFDFFSLNFLEHLNVEGNIANTSVVLKVSYYEEDILDVILSPSNPSISFHKVVLGTEVNISLNVNFATSSIYLSANIGGYGFRDECIFTW